MSGTTAESGGIDHSAGEQLPQLAGDKPDEAYNHFAAKANITKKLGIVQVVVGSISFFLGLVMIPIAPGYIGSRSGGGIWSGIFIVIAGSLCIAAGSNPNIYCSRCGALIMCIVSMLFLIGCGIMNFVFFAIGFTCKPPHCYWDIYSQTTICDNDNCVGFVGGPGPYLSLVLFLLMLFLFIITLMSTIFTGRNSCSPCTGNKNKENNVTRPLLGPGSGVSAASSYQATTGSTPAYCQHHAYVPPTSGEYPPVPTCYQPSSSRHQIPYPGQGQQYRQAASTVPPPYDPNQ